MPYRPVATRSRRRQSAADSTLLTSRRLFGTALTTPLHDLRRSLAVVVAVSVPNFVRYCVYVGSGQFVESGVLYAVDAESGVLKWAFDESEAPLSSTPTVVDEPSDGHSIGSRIQLGTLGHHHEIVDRVTTEDETDEDETDDTVPGFGMGKAVISATGIGTLLAWRQLNADERSNAQNDSSGVEEN